MAAYYVRAAGGNWTASATWSTDAVLQAGGAAAGSAPTAADDCLFVAGSGVVTADAGSVCRSLDCTNYATVLTIANSATALAVGDASGGAFTLGTLMTLTLAGSSAIITFKSTSNNGGTGWGITTAGKTMPATTFNGAGGKWVLQDAFSCGAAALNATTGTLDFNSLSVTCGNWVKGALTLTTGTQTLTASGTTFTGNGATYSTVVLNGAGTVTASGTNTFTGFTRTGTALKTDALTLSANQTVTGTLTLGGNTTQGVNRLLVQSSAVGTQRTITCTGAAVVISGDVDFIDIAITGSPSWTNTGAKFVGDCGGNGSLITTNMTAAATQTHTASAGGNYSDVTKWTSRVPLPQDNVIVNVNTTGTLTVDMPRLGADHTFTGFAGTLTLGIAPWFFGSLTFSSGMGVTGSFVTQFMGRATHTVTSNGKTWFSIRMGASGQTAGAGTFTFLDAVTSTVSLVVSSANVTFNGSVSIGVGGAGLFLSDQTTSITNLNGQTVTLAQTASAASWQFTAGTLSAAGSTIVISTASINIRTFAGGGKTYGTLTYTVAGSTGGLTVTGANTFATINFSDANNARTLTLPTATTTTVTTLFNVNGTAGKLMTVVGDVSSPVQQSCDYLSLTNSDATGGPWYAGANSVNGGGNTGWIFTAPPSGLTERIVPRGVERGVLRGVAA